MMLSSCRIFVPVLLFLLFFFSLVIVVVVVVFVVVVVVAVAEVGWRSLETCVTELSLTTAGYLRM